MAKTKHFKTVVFTQDYGVRLKGSEYSCDGMMAHELVRVEKVAVFKTETQEETKVVNKQKSKKG